MVGLSSCKKEDIEGKTKKSSKFADELRSSPENITLGSNTLMLETFLWRDFMSIAEENGSKMMCINRLIDVDSVPLPNTMKLKKQYVIKGNEVWAADYMKTSNDIDYILSGSVRDGPKWGPKIEVDVVCEFENSGITFRIIAKSQLINRTE